jgi:hypothetical protein
VRVTTNRRVGAAGGEGLGDPVGRRDSLRLLQELLARRQAGPHLGQTEAQRPEHSQTGDDEDHGPRADPHAHSVPDRPLRVHGLRLSLMGHDRPEDPPPEEHQGGRQDDKGEHHRDDHADGTRDAQPAGGGDDGEHQRQQPEHHGGGAGEHRLSGVPDGAGHRGIPVAGGS